MSSWRTLWFSPSVVATEIQGAREPLANEIGGAGQGIRFEMRVASSGLWLRVPKKFAHNRKTKACSGTDGRKRMPEIMNPNAFQPRIATNRGPRLLEVCPRFIRDIARDHECTSARMSSQNFESRPVQYDSFAPGLRIREQ